MQQSIIHRIFWGLILVGIGVVFLLNQIGATTLDIGQLFSVYWPVIIILFGIQGLLLQRRGGYCWNPIVVLVGIFFLGRNLDWFQWELSDLIRFAGPVLLILYGLVLMTRGGRRRKRRGWEDGDWNPVTPPPVPPASHVPPGPPPEPQPYDSPNAFKENPTEAAGGTDEVPPPPPSKDAQSGWQSMQETHRRHRDHHESEKMWKQYHRFPGYEYHGGRGREDHSRFIGDVMIGHNFFELKPMSISHFIGDTTLDLTRAQISAGETRIYVSSFIGDVKVFVPNDFNVGVRVVSSCLIGDVAVLEQKRGGIFNQMSVETPNFPDTDKQVVLVVSTLIGDVRVTKVG